MVYILKTISILINFSLQYNLNLRTYTLTFFNQYFTACKISSARDDYVNRKFANLKKEITISECLFLVNIIVEN